MIRPASRNLLLLIVALAWVAPVSAENLDDYVARQMKEHQIPGLSLGVMRASKSIKAKSYGLANLEWGAPVSTETVFEIGSITKQFTAAAILMLAEEGKLRLDDSLTNYFEVPPAWKPITLRHLLTHTSGIKTYNNLPGFQASRHLTAREFIDKLAAFPPAFAPGEAFAYCNSGYNLLGYVIEKVSGQSYWDFLAGRIFNPLGMKHTQARTSAAIIPLRAAGYEMEQQKLGNRDPELTDIFSAGAIVSTVPDLMKWNAALNSDRLLKSSSREQMWTPFTLTGGKSTGYSFGWRVDDFEGRKNIGHSGSTSGFSASLQRFPDDKLTVIVLCNSGEQNIATTLARAIAEFYFSSAGR